MNGVAVEPGLRAAEYTKKFNQEMNKLGEQTEDFGNPDAEVLPLAARPEPDEDGIMPPTLASEATGRAGGATGHYRLKRPAQHEAPGGAPALPNAAGSPAASSHEPMVGAPVVAAGSLPDPIAAVDAPPGGGERAAPRRLGDRWVVGPLALRLRFDEYRNPAGKTYNNWKVECQRHRNCFKTREASARTSSKHGPIEPVAFLVARAQLDDIEGVKHTRQTPSPESVEGTAVLHQATLRDVVRSGGP